MFHIGYTQFRSEKKTLMQELKTPSESTEQAVRAVYDSVADNLTHISDSLCSYFILQFWNELLLSLPSSSSFLSPATKNTYLDHTLSICLSLSAFNDRNNFSKTLFLSLLSALPSLMHEPQFYDTLLCRLASYSALNSNLPVLLQLLFKHTSSLSSRYAVHTCIHDNAYSARAKGGWLPLYAGIAGGADVILLPEIPYDIDKIAKTLDNRIANGKKFSILAVAEGALSKEEAAMKKKDFKKARAEMKYPSIVYRLADELASRVDNEIRVCVPGHFQRGGSPCAYDRVLSTRFGAAAARLIREKNYGNMVGLVNGKIVPVPLSEVAGKLKTVPVDCEEILAAREIGISFGD